MRNSWLKLSSPSGRVREGSANPKGPGFVQVESLDISRTCALDLSRASPWICPGLALGFADPSFPRSGRQGGWGLGGSAKVRTHTTRDWRTLTKELHKKN